MVVDSSDDIVILGSSDGKYAVLCRRGTGASDDSFGKSGLGIVPTDEEADGVVVAAVGLDGQVVTASPLGAAITPEAKAQGGFGTRGGVALDFGTTEQSLSAVLVEADGHVVVASTAGDRIALARYTSDGKPDSASGH
ncbi:hypothetical protein ACFW96_29020 [Streptomyces gardneri]|uniref:hypothetical protein n=1 Tax=Streptomyces gardneri TaxID=66892 RepID=UPI0036CD61D5